MLDFNNGTKSKGLISHETNENFSIFFGKVYEDDIPHISLNSTGEEKIFFNNQNFLNNKREKETNKQCKKPHTKYTIDNLRRACKHLVIENVMKFINKKIYDAYKGNIGDGILKKELVKLNQSQKKNSSIEFNQVFLYKTLKEIFSQAITKKIKFLSEDHNKKLIEKIVEEKGEIFINLFNLKFIDCVEHFIENKQIEELNGMTLFSELKNQIIEKFQNDGENYYQNLEVFLKEFEKRINNAKPRKKTNLISEEL